LLVSSEQVNALEALHVDEASQRVWGRSRSHRERLRKYV